MTADGRLIAGAGEAYEAERLITAAGKAFDSGRRADCRCGRGL